MLKNIINGNAIASTGSTRLRLHRQVEIIPKSNLTLSIKINTVPGYKEDASFDLHYFELACAGLKSQGEHFFNIGTYVSTWTLLFCYSPVTNYPCT